ncbi:hypothetical protein F5877DRAFT_83294 [Lentinula edodes]|nr:hypothetical protein F5877DRAFT_83294 [Lentinula edodes]
MKSRKTEAAPGRLSKLLSPVKSFMNHILRRPRYLDPSTLPAGRLNSPPVTTASSPPISSSSLPSLPRGSDVRVVATSLPPASSRAVAPLRDLNQRDKQPARKFTELAGTSWNILRQTLSITKNFSDPFPPLKAAVTGLLMVMDYVEKVNDVQTDFGELAVRMEGLNTLLQRYQNQEADLPVSVSTRLNNFARQIEIIYDKMRRGVVKRTLEAPDDSQEIVRILRTLAALVDGFTIETTLSTDINVEAIRSQLGNFTQGIPRVNILSALCDPEGYPEEYKGCLPGTCRASLHTAVENLKLSFDSNVNQKFWLTGVAGSGKSTISTSLATTLRAEGVTVATFFCKRDQASRRDPRRVIPTLAWYLASTFPGFREKLGPTLLELKEGRRALPSNPTAQLDTLILEPLQGLVMPYGSHSSPSISSPIVILIDALDESDDHSRHLLVDAFISHSIGFPIGVSVVLVSRKTWDLQKKLQSLPILLDLDQRLHNPSMDSDIRLYLENRLRDIRDQQEEEPNWPSEFEVSSLTKRADGLFIWAVIACNFIEQPSCRDELSRLLKTNIVVGIDDLYAHALGSEFSKMQGKVAWLEDYRTIMGCIICSISPLSPVDIACLIARPLNVVNATLSILQPLLYRDEKHLVRLVHASLADFLLDEGRSQQLWVAHSYLHATLSRGCLNALIQFSQESSPLLDLKALSHPSSFIHIRYDEIPSHIQYSSAFWASHLDQAHLGEIELSQISHIVETFLKTSFLSWVEILSILHAVANGLHSLEILCKWAEEQKVSFQNLASDSHYFLETFRVPIQNSPAHIYISALPWAPPASLIAQIYLQKLDPERCNLPVVLSGLPFNWPSDYSLNTLGLNMEEISGEHTNGFLMFSPDGSLLAHATGQELRVWEVQSGLLICGPLLHNSKILALEVSADNRYIASAAMSITDHSYDLSLNVVVFRITTETMSPIFFRGIKVATVPEQTTMKFMVFSTDNKQLHTVTDYLDFGQEMDTWYIETGEPIKPSPQHTLPQSNLQSTKKAIFEHATGWLLNDNHFGASSAYCFIPYYAWNIRNIMLQLPCATAVHESSVIALVFDTNPIIVQFPKDWETEDIRSRSNSMSSVSTSSDMAREVFSWNPKYKASFSSISLETPPQPTDGFQEPINVSQERNEDDFSHESFDGNLESSYANPSFFGLDEAAIFARYQSLLTDIRFSELCENFVTQNDERSMVLSSEVQYFSEDPVSMPYIYILGELPPDVSLWVPQQDKGETSEQLRFRFIPCHVDEVAGVKHFIVLGQRGFWPVYIIFDSHGRNEKR